VKLIFIPSINHTGTNFLIEFFLQCFPEKNWNFVSVPALLKNPVLCRQEIECSDNAFTPGLAPSGNNLVHGHINEKDIPFLQMLAIASGYTVVPLRDPLLSVITQAHRRLGKGLPAEEQSTFIVKQWVLWIKHFHQGGELINPLYLKVDTKENYTRRLDTLESLLYFLELKYQKNLINTWAKRWPLHNPSRGEYELKMLYEMRNLKELKNRLPLAFEAFRDNETLIRDFMEGKGYSCWWWR